MATLMQKDVLLEMAANVRGNIFYNKANVQESEEIADRQFISDKRNFFYSTNPADLDYESELKSLQQLKQKYEVNNG